MAKHGQSKPTMQPYKKKTSRGLGGRRSRVIDIGTAHKRPSCAPCLRLANGRTPWSTRDDTCACVRGSSQRLYILVRALLDVPSYCSRRPLCVCSELATCRTMSAVLFRNMCYWPLPRLGRRDHSQPVWALQALYRFGLFDFVRLHFLREDVPPSNALHVRSLSTSDRPSSVKTTRDPRSHPRRPSHSNYGRRWTTWTSVRTSFGVLTA
ncbi:hypothetical protein C8Q79DRAFT_513069 [Trametes meyenii]|nr:hypothetical protein C8Q79DRAFT_513069 [Trametes meyenii]